MATKEIAPLGKLMWEKQLFELSGNWKAAELIEEKISKYNIHIKERKPINEELGSELESTAVSD